jgi:hypothetical protein
MMRWTIIIVLGLVSAALASGYSAQKYPFALEVTCRGQGIPGIAIYIDGVSQGATDSNGRLTVHTTDGYHIVKATKNGCGDISKRIPFDHRYSKVKLEFCGCKSVV